jgi:protein required for attachment to host cells
MKARTIWIVVADEAIARILQWRGHGHELEPVEEVTDPDAHARGAELRRDAVGRRAGGAPAGTGQSGGRNLRSGAGMAASAGEDEERVEAEAFARRVAARLDERLREQRFEELRIAAAPRFLGLLRRALSPQVAATVREEVSKDLVHLTAREISERVFEDRLATR